MTNDINLSNDFRRKLKFLKDISIESACEFNTIVDRNFITRRYPFNFSYIIKICVDDYDLIECEKWLNLTYRELENFSTNYKIDIGPFRGLFPVRVDFGEVHLKFKSYEPSWRDWFIVDEDLLNDQYIE